VSTTVKSTDLPGKTHALCSISGRFLLGEFIGSFGDLGTFLPIAVGMVQIVGFDAGTVLLSTGIACVLAGLVFRCPMSVQPMKALAALALCGALTAAQVSVAGLAVGLCMLLLAAGGLMHHLNRTLPKPILRGLQMAVAFQLLIGGIRLAFLNGTVIRPLLGVNGLLVAFAGLVLVVLWHKQTARVALVLLVCGFAGASINSPGLLDASGISLWRPGISNLEVSAFSGLWLGALPQLPLTLLNSVFAVSLLAGQLFPKSQHRTTPTRIGVSIGLMNLFVFIFGGMPLCHGSGGVAAHHRFGARSHVAVIIRGATLMLLGLLFGRAAMAWMLAFPTSLLGVFLFIAGTGLARSSRCWQTRAGLVASVLMILVHAATGVLAIGFGAGWIAYAITNLKQKPTVAEPESA